jgi:hypothetical protein
MLMAGDDDSVKALEDFVPRLVAGGLGNQGWIAAGSSDGTLVAGGPQADATARLLDLGAVNGDAQIGIGGEPGGLLSSEDASG